MGHWETAFFNLPQMICEPMEAQHRMVQIHFLFLNITFVFLFIFLLLVNIYNKYNLFCLLCLLLSLSFSLFNSVFLAFNMQSYELNQGKWTKIWFISLRNGYLLRHINCSDCIQNEIAYLSYKIIQQAVHISILNGLV